MKQFIIKYKAETLGVFIGAVAGWAYWYFVGCTSGSCAITSSPVNSSIYGAFAGIVLGGTLKKQNKKEEKNTVK